jgi:polysaccharide biosynthesis/export protein
MSHNRLMSNWLAAIFVALAGLFPIAASAQQSPISLSGGYVLGPSDVIEVSVLGRDDYKTRVQVQADGTIALPLIGTVTAANVTVTQLRDEVKRRLIAGGFFSKPEVSVTLTSGVSRYVVVLGEVGSPGVLPIEREYRLSEIVARAGGLRGAGVDIVTLTPPGGTPSEYSIQAIATGAAADPAVDAGAKVFVAPAKLFYIYGQIGNPGSYAIDSGMTVRRALARGGGLTSIGSENKVKLYRGDSVFKAKLDEPLQPGDTVVVGERFF